jgi:hypothetical protein
MSNLKKAAWIADELGEDVDDVYDVLLGGIRYPNNLVDRVETAANEYDNQKERGLHETRVREARDDEGGDEPIESTNQSSVRGFGDGSDQAF